MRLENRNQTRLAIRHAIFAALLFGAAVPARAADESLVILPQSIHLSGSESRQRLLVEDVRDGHLVGQRSDGVTIQTSDPKVARVERGILIPVGNGTATVTAIVDGREASANVIVDKLDVLHQWSFRNHVQSVLSKTGCNSGACHGAAAGKSGFKLSLRGYDPDFDFRVITRQSRGRRIVPSDPGRSLLLMKPTGALPHKGGVRFDVDSNEYHVIADWLAAGHRSPSADDPRLERLEILPKRAVLKRGMTQQIVVLAHFTDGHTEDVTPWVKYTSSNLSVAKVDDTGQLTVTGYGEGSVVSWYLSNNVVASFAVPYENDVSEEMFAGAARSNFVDDLVLEKLESLNIPPSPLATDAEFLRRASLDTIGMLPTAEQTRAFLDDSSADKRTKLVDRLLSRPEYVDYWSYKWCDLLLVSSARLRPKAVDAYYKWIRDRVSNNVPWDEFARDIVTAKGSTHSNGASNFYALHDEPLGMAETVSMTFLGMSINCARCHDHPLEKWTNDDYYGMANLFSRVRGKTANGDGNRSIFMAADGELIQPRTGSPQPPRPLDGEAVSFESTTDRRLHLADWLTSPENPYFTRAIVNRIWANFMGVGIVERVDDLRLTNPPSNEPLLASLADYLVENEYDLKRLMRVILTSQTYQRSSKSVSGNEADERFYSRYIPRRMQAEVLLDALGQATDSPTKFEGYPLGTRALELRDANVSSYFLQTFGRPDRVITCECERSDDPTMVQVLHIVNGDTLNKKLEAAGNRIERLLEAKTANESLIDEIYLAALTRFPTKAEKDEILNVLSETQKKQQQLVASIKAAYQETFSRETLEDETRTIDKLVAKEKRLVLEDLMWGILSSREFLFHH